MSKDRERIKTKPLYRIGQQIYLKSNPFELETIRRIVTDLRGAHWYYTTMSDGVQRKCGIPEDFIRRAH